MTPVAAMWLASIVGALLFFAAGALLARSRSHTVASPIGDVALPPPAPRVPRRRAETEQTYTADTLDDLLRRTARMKGVRAVVFADDMGLPIAGVGEHVSQLAAFAALVCDASTKGSEFLPIVRPKRVVVDDVHGVTITTCPQRTDDATFVLVTLSVGPGPGIAHLEKVLGRAVDAIQ